MAWVQRLHNHGVIDRAGAALVPWWRGEGVDDVQETLRLWAIVDNWRSSHAYPLNSVQVNLRSRVARVAPGALVVQRMKRFSSLMNKLARQPRMSLSQMHDLGGCRAIFDDVAAIDEIVALYRPRRQRDLFGGPDGPKCYDYIRKPKPDGYRGVHLVVRFVARSSQRKLWNGQRIEIQLRSRLQHAFATAVETVTTFTREPLKFGGGSEEWRGFFSLMGSVLALREGTPIVAGTSSDPEVLIEQLRAAEAKLRVRQRLRGWAAAIHVMPSQNLDEPWLVLRLDLDRPTIQVAGYPDASRAAASIAPTEQQPSSGIDAVVVKVNDLKTIRLAYPNYYADASAFLDALDAALQ